MATEDRPQYPKLTPEQKTRVLDELAQEIALNNLRPVTRGR
jgi:hypothetical protein